ncbi:CDP-alcohol phosphatidyltransferase family protein [Tessaracoccus defluvii]|uniref:CDP-alcohol phosphatidyltransferase family protein n=1 Tax=Tessaracoccus defluvii TaxID=1285901 RepID=A0A7H0HAC5_9ACTN|nr:CDP-alcohol phosphatidyltransferase family protein [Tessaracoccus defluvii]QNP57491.1 CDP-alcohol phosphatidyltransferase family protein [Tessaracoccus defluvii]
MQLVPTQEWDTDRVFTIPNILSFIRLLAIPVFCWLILVGQDLAAVGMLAVFGATDWVDGYLARRLKQRTALGAKLDPVADRLYILATVFALLVREIVPWWFVAILLARDVMLALLVPVLRRHGLVALPVNMVGKLGTLLLLVSLPLILLGSPLSLDWQVAHWAGWILGWGGAVAYWTAGLLYVRETVLLAREPRESS